MWSEALNTALADSRVKTKLELLVRNGYMAYDDEEFVSVGFLENYTINFNRENLCAKLEIPLENKDFKYSDEFDHANLIQGGAEVKFDLTIYSEHLDGGEETHTIFHGLIEDCKPDNYEFGIMVLDMLIRAEKCTCEISMEAEAVEDSGNPGNFFFENVDLKNLPAYDAYTYGVDEALQAAALGENGERRAFKVRAMRVLCDKGLGAGFERMKVDEYQIVCPLGVIKFYQAPNPAYDYRLDIVTFYKEGTNNVEEIIEAGLRYPFEYGGPAYGNTRLVEGTTGTITVVNASKDVVGVGTLFESELEPGDRIRILDSTWGIVDTITDDENLVLLYAWRDDSSAGSVTYEKSTLQHAYVSISKYKRKHTDGYISDMFRDLREDHTRRNYFIYYDPDADKIRGKNVYIKAVPDRSLIDAVRIAPLRTMEDIYTRVYTQGTYERVQNLLNDAGQITVLFDGTWIQNTGEYDGFTFGDIGTVLDGDLYIGHAVSKDGAAEDEYVDYIKIDLGEVKDVDRIILYPIGPQNPKQFPMYITVEGSEDDTTYLELDPSTVDQELKPGGNPLDLKDFLYGEVRYIKIKITPCKWVRTGIGRTIGLGEIRIYGNESVEAVAKIQNTNPAGGRTVSGVFISDYYPGLYEKTSQFAYRTFLDKDAPVFDDISAADRAYIFLNELIRMALYSEWECPIDPRNRLFDTVHISDDFFPDAPAEYDALVEEIDIQDGAYKISGTNYSAGPLE